MSQKRLKILLRNFLRLFFNKLFCFSLTAYAMTIVIPVDCAADGPIVVINDEDYHHNHQQQQ